MKDNEKLLKLIPQQPQDQGALNDQLRQLQAFANKLGLYDAADFISEVIKDRKKNV